MSLASYPFSVQQVLKIYKIWHIQTPLNKKTDNSSIQNTELFTATSVERKLTYSVNIYDIVHCFKFQHIFYSPRTFFCPTFNHIPKRKPKNILREISFML
jgi:hypothetical protein